MGEQKITMKGQTVDVRFLVNLACACVADVRRGRARGFRAREEESSRPPFSLERGLAPKFPSKNNTQGNKKIIK